MGFLSALSVKGAAVLLFFLAFQFLFLCLALSPDAKGLEWAKREDRCTTQVNTVEQVEATYTTSFFTTRICQEVDGRRTCEDYEKVGGSDIETLIYSNNELDAAEDDYKDAGGLAASSLAFTLIQILMLLISLGCKKWLAVCGRDQVAFQVLFMFLSGLMVLFAIGAAGVAGDSDALTSDLSTSVGKCNNIERDNGYGIGIHAFLVFWILAQIALVLLPLGPLAEDKEAAEKSGPGGLAGTADASYATEPAQSTA